MDITKITTQAGIYKFTNIINNKIYIGKSTNIRNRINAHKRSETDFKIKGCFANAIKKYKFENFSLEILESYTDITNEELLDKESIWIIKLNSTNRDIGYNVTIYGTDTTGFKQSEEQKKKTSLRLIGNTYNKGKKASRETIEKRSGENSHMYGKAHKIEALQTLSKALKGKIISEETRKKLKNVNGLNAKKTILQFNLITKEFIKKWDSITHASKELKINQTSIASVCRKYVTKKGLLIKSAGGFYWEFENKNELQIDKETNVIKKNIYNKKIEQRDLLTGKIIKEWENIKEASKALDINIDCIRKVCNQQKRTNGSLCRSAGGFNWKYI